LALGEEKRGAERVAPEFIETPSPGRRGALLIASKAAE